MTQFIYPGDRRHKTLMASEAIVLTERTWMPGNRRSSSDAVLTRSALFAKKYGRSIQFPVDIPTGAEQTAERYRTAGQRR